MNYGRRDFNVAMTAALLGPGLMPNKAYSQSAATGEPAGGVARSTSFFKSAGFERAFQASLGRTYQMGGDIGRTLYIGRQVTDGDFDSAYAVFRQAADDARALADDCSAGGHRESARQAYLWAQNYYDTATYFVDGSSDPSRFLGTWEQLDACWLKSCGLFSPAIEQVSIPYEGTQLRGFYFRAATSGRKRPLLILNNGSDGSLLDMWVQGGSGAVARGYDCLTFDGPGQGYALWKQKLYFRADWEKVITPVVDFALTLKGVDPKRIALQGISQGGYWVPRALAFEKRIAAGIADPGVVDVSTSWVRSLPKPLVGLLNSGRRDEFDAFLAKGLPPSAKAYLNFRMRPYGLSSYYDVFHAVLAYNLNDVAGQIQCPLLITEPVNEDFWPGQSRQLYELLKSPRKLQPFSEREGADLHCEPMAPGLRDLRVFNWLDDILH